MTNTQVAEHWAKGLSAKTDHLFTDGKTIWSYGTHFPIATKQYRTKGQGRYVKMVWNIDEYSVSTSKHQGIIARILGFENKKDLEKNAEHIIFKHTIEIQTLIGDRNGKS